LTINLNCGIYQIRNVVTGFCLAGQSMRLKQRPGEHWNDLKNNKHDNSHMQNSYNKHSREFFVFEILLYCEPEELTRYEQFFVDKYVFLGLAYNTCRECVDSPKGIKRSEETRGKMREAWKNRAPMTEETRKKISEANSNPSEETLEKMSEAQRGENHPMYGKHHTEETLEKMSEATKSRPPVSKETRKSMSIAAKNKPSITEETRKRMSENHWDNSGENHPMHGKRGKDSPNFGKHHTEEVRNNMSKSKKGENNGMFGRHHTEETLEKMSEAKSGKNNCQYGKKGKDSHSTIKEKVVLNVLELLEDGISVMEILKEIEISKPTVYKIKNGGYDDIYNLPKKTK